MFLDRLLELDLDHTFLLFGARGVGKSALIEKLLCNEQHLSVNLLDADDEEKFARNPNELIELVEAMPNDSQYVVIDEVQKLPKLLDVIHLLIETRKSKKTFVLTGSSARKLKAGGANLLAGRAFIYHLYPFTYLELGGIFELESALSWGMLPKVLSLNSGRAKQKFLQAYSQVYLKEEVWSEQLVRNLDPFRKFLEVAAQGNGKIINYANIARDVGADAKTIKSYFSILEDTLLGFMLEPFHHSFRKRLKRSSKFYFIDVGIARSLGRMLTVKPQKSTSYYGDLYEQFVVAECIKLASYHKPEFKFSYLQTESGLEVDLIVERPGKSLLLIEIKSAESVRQEALSSLKKTSQDLGDCEAVCFSNDSRRRKIDEIIIYPWQEGVKHFFSD